MIKILTFNNSFKCLKKLGFKCYQGKGSRSWALDIDGNETQSIWINQKLRYSKLSTLSGQGSASLWHDAYYWLTESKREDGKYSVLFEQRESGLLIKADNNGHIKYDFCAAKSGNGRDFKLKDSYKGWSESYVSHKLLEWVNQYSHLFTPMLYCRDKDKTFPILGSTARR